jgi:hypothetical protein
MEGLGLWQLKMIWTGYSIVKVAYLNYF